MDGGMSDDGPTDAEWEAFWRSFQEYGTPFTLEQQALQVAEDIWEDVSPRYSAEEKVVAFVRNGEFGANMAGHVYLAALSYVVYQQTLQTMFDEDVLDTLADELQAQVEPPTPEARMRSERKCPNCGAATDPAKEFCENCGEEL